MAYKATVTRIKNIRLHSNASKLKLGNACNFQVVIGLDTVENTLGLFFPTDGTLSQAFADANNLVRKTDPETGERSGGLFDENKRVRAQKLRGEISEGFWCELSYLEKVPGIKKSTIEKLKEGDEFTELDGVEICHKYVTRATKANTSQKPGQARKKNKCFKEHLETAQFRKEVDKIPLGSTLYITEKLHGTSGRYGRVLCEQPCTRWERFKKRLGFTVKPRFEYEFLAGSRRVVLDNKHKPDSGFYQTDSFRLGFMKDVWPLLNKGEVIYGEIVGWTTNDAPIMQRVNTKVLKDKAFTKQYGTDFVYKYGCPQDTCKFYVYRITMVNEDGVVTELPWPQVQTRAASLGLQSVPEFNNRIYAFKHSWDPEEEVKDLRETVARLVEGPSTLDPSHIREGVVIRVEGAGHLEMLKEKSWQFRALEDHTKTDETTIDIEEQQEFINAEESNNPESKQG